MKEILAKLGTIQTALKVPKNQYNSFGEYKYRSCEDILEALKPLLHEQNCTLLLTDNIEVHNERYYVVAKATIYDSESGENITNTAYARETETRPKMDTAQITGTASSYARKYALNGLFLIDDTKDPDSNEYKQQQLNSPAPAPAPAPPPVICPKCNKEIKPIKKKSGEIVEPAKILESCGGVCSDCYKAAKGGKK